MDSTKRNCSIYLSGKSCSDAPKEIIRILDIQMLQQTLTFILDNAVKFSPSESEIILRLREEQSIATIEIIDQGPGIPPEERDRIFDVFAIQDVDHHTKGQGNSLGICKYVMQLQGGDISAHQSESGGACIRLEYPMDVEI